MRIFGIIPFIKLQNHTQTTVKRRKTMKNEIGELSHLFVFVLSSVWKNLVLAVILVSDCLADLALVIGRKGKGST